MLQKHQFSCFTPHKNLTTKKLMIAANVKSPIRYIQTQQNHQKN